ncbi:hypothetical protein DM01DRAFT_1096375 [Hesseltinella vesiculosa]|uniref:Eukaryotic translation initiation factor SUI1 family protein n=1 Tax=Hesseltinella vesiculosa TaxID=101127 RepID=A0A1X2GCF7_9FUNG|nr:hypothetical protein DM01DRAFT_1096375 [Hesseltinella vesiculosa]
MFKKPIATLKSFSPLRSSDKRRFQNEIYEAYPALKALKIQEQEQINQQNQQDQQPEAPSDTLEATIPAPAALFPDTVKVAKFVSHCKQPGTVYVADNNPLWFKTIDGPPIPTVYSMWQFPTMLPTLYTWGPVIEKLMEGADLMIPGLVGEVPVLQQGDLVAITIRGYKYPLAIGTMALPSADIKVRSGMKGKAVLILHVYHDSLWSMGDKTEPPALSTAEAQEDADTIDPSQALEATPTKEPAAPKKEVARKAYSVQEIDDILKEALVQGLLYKLTKEKAIDILPISTSSLYTAYILPSRPRGMDPDVDIKKSSWKKVQKFIKAMEKLGMLKVKEQRGESNVTSINWSHESFKGVERYKTIEIHPVETSASNNAQEEASGGSGTVQVIDYYKPHQAGTIALFEAVKRSKNDYYNLQQVRQVVLDYIQQEKLIHPSNPKKIKIDAVLTDAILNKDEYNTVDHLGRDQIIQRLVAKLQPFHNVIVPNKEGVMKKGAPKSIEIVQEVRQGRKTMTKVSGMETFGVDIDDLCKELTKLCASSATSNAIVGTSPKAPLYEVLVQGPQIKHVSELLLRKGIPKKFIMVHDKTAKKGKK